MFGKLWYKLARKKITKGSWHNNVKEQEIFINPYQYTLYQVQSKLFQAYQETKELIRKQKIGTEAFRKTSRYTSQCRSGDRNSSTKESFDPQATTQRLEAHQ